MRTEPSRRYQEEQELNLWLRRRNRQRGWWLDWAIWRVIGWGILVGVFLILVSMCYAYR